MVRLSKIEITNFKGIQSATVKPGKLNVITGRNNAGKTSLMQAIAVLSDPTVLEGFGSNASSVIYGQSETASLSGEYYSNQESTVRNDSKDKDDTTPSTQSLDIINSEGEEVYNAVIRTLNSNIPEKAPRMGRLPLEKGDLELDQGEQSKDKPDELILSEMVQESLDESILSIPKDEIIDRFSGSVLTVKSGNQEQYLLSAIEEYGQLTHQIAQNAVENLLEDDRIVDTSDSENNNRERFRRPLSHAVRTSFTPRSRSVAQLVGEPLPRVSGIHYISDIPTDASEFDYEDNPVRVNQIENYLQSHNMVDHLEDFSFTHLVFQEDSGSPYDVPFEFMGEGFKVIIGILWELFDESNDGDVLLIEEPEQHMHPGYIEELTRTLINIVEEEQLQLFITTHNPDFLESFVSKEVGNQYGEFLEENFCLFQLTDPIHRSLSYSDAKEDMQELNLDLRGA